MELIIQHLQNSLEDTILSKAEKGELKSLVSKHSLSDHELSFLRSKIYSLAMEKANAENYSFIIEWIKAANNALVTNSEGAGVFLARVKNVVMPLSTALMELSTKLVFVCLRSVTIELPMLL